MCFTSSDPKIPATTTTTRLKEHHKSINKKKLAMGYCNMPFSLSMTRLLLNELVLLVLIFTSSPAQCTTDPTDVQALQVMYTSLNSPSKLTNWKTSGGDPCGETWKGVTCEGSAVVSVTFWNHGILTHQSYVIETFDLSNNNMHDPIPYQLPPNLTSLNLAGNNFSGNIPYSISSMVSLTYLNASRNSLSLSVEDVFANLSRLGTLDLSFNNFSGNLPMSFSSLSNLSTLYLQNNQLTGSLDVLSGLLPLTTLNVAKNNFSGWIPRELFSVPTFVYDGNSFADGPAPPSPPGGSRNKRNPRSGARSSPASDGQSSDSDNGLSAGIIVGIVLGSLLLLVLAVLALIFCIRRNEGKVNGARPSRENLSVSTGNVHTEMQEQRVKNVGAVVDLKPLAAEPVAVERMSKSGSLNRMKSPITATTYTVTSLQTATNSFSQEYLIGEGSLGRVYKAEFPNGKEDNFLEAVSSMSRLRHPNIVTLVGFCAEHGQRLLVYEYIGTNSLHDMLHFSDDGSRNLSWNARVRVALGTARALEYLHEVCLPLVVHRNFKSANILLDEELNPHLSDCGLAALTPNTERQVSTQMVGSFGYSAPEFALSGVYTVKSDVYSFGVVMLELLTGRKPLDSSRARSEQSLVRWATPQLHDIDALAKMVDPALNGMYPAKSLSRFADIIALCVQPEPEFRPPMSEVVQALVRLVQRASVVKRRSSDDSGFGHKTPDHEIVDMSF
ncbi:Protein STRUBBELIG-RECEPTOR FAMILY 8 [Hibiscus syriacus]|uniref:Protein STRUBBELIG-RECEPTOR FAMILY 8 n=1 Tax=Hibiscus syriacus TaxID=106335 RepID=A0A6A2Z3R5_HIBSY|nr:Protein STRUBBELIG-RECEPTOR FAMILY 8 [Hibiscus syriacus]